MSLKGPNDQDLRKLHSEVNQLVNQRFVLTTLAVTLFGAITAWQIPRSVPAVGDEIGIFRFSVAVMLLVFLFLLFLLGHQLSGMLRVVTTYLVETGASGWEDDWRRFRAGRYLGYTKPQSIVFLVLGILAAGFPFALWAAFSLALVPRSGALLTLIAGATYAVFVIGMGFFSWFNPEEAAAQRWSRLARDTAAQPAASSGPEGSAPPPHSGR